MRIPQKSITGADWLALKPYDRLGKYDQFYLQLANTLLPAVKEAENHLAYFGSQPEKLRRLILILVSYFEDQVNEIGMWQALTERCQELTGHLVPFYNPEGHDPGYVNWQDLSLLTWHYFNTATDKVIAPDFPGIRMVGERAEELFRSKWDQAPRTDFYEDYLVIEPEEEADFFLLKEKLTWLALESYLLGSPFSVRYQAKLKEVLKPEEGALGPSAFAHMAYAMRNPYLFTQNSTWLAFTAPEFLAELLDASDTYLDSLQAPMFFLEGYFQFLGEDEQYYHLKHQQYGVELAVVKSSADLASGLRVPGTQMFTSLIRWKGDWWISGVVIEAEGGSADPSDLPGVPFMLQDEENQARVRETTDLMEQAFVQNMGDHLKVFDSLAEAQREMDRFFETYSRTLSVDSEGGESPQRVSITLTQEYLDQEGRLGVAFIPGEGLLFVPNLPRVSALLQRRDDLDEKEQWELYQQLLAGGLPAYVARRLLEYHPMTALKMPIPASQVNALPYAEFLWRYTDPDGFGERVPKMNVV